MTTPIDELIERFEGLAFTGFDPVTQRHFVEQTNSWQAAQALRQQQADIEEIVRYIRRVPENLVNPSNDYLDFIELYQTEGKALIAKHTKQAAQ